MRRGPVSRSLPPLAPDARHVALRCSRAFHESRFLRANSAACDFPRALRGCALRGRALLPALRCAALATNAAGALEKRLCCRRLLREASETAGRDNHRTHRGTSQGNHDRAGTGRRERNRAGTFNRRRRGNFGRTGNLHECGAGLPATMPALRRSISLSVPASVTSVGSSEFDPID